MDIFPTRRCTLDGRWCHDMIEGVDDWFYLQVLVRYMMLTAGGSNDASILMFLQQTTGSITRVPVALPALCFSLTKWILFLLISGCVDGSIFSVWLAKDAQWKFIWIYISKNVNIKAINVTESIFHHLYSFPRPFNALEWVNCCWIMAVLHWTLNRRSSARLQSWICFTFLPSRFWNKEVSPSLAVQCVQTSQWSCSAGARTEPGTLSIVIFYYNTAVGGFEKAHYHRMTKMLTKSGRL